MQDIVTLEDLVNNYGVALSKIEALTKELEGVKRKKKQSMDKVRANPKKYDRYLDKLSRTNPEAFVTECFVYNLYGYYISWEMINIIQLPPGNERKIRREKWVQMCAASDKRYMIGVLKAREAEEESIVISED